MRSIFLALGLALVNCSGDISDVSQSDDEDLSSCPELKEVLVWSPRSPARPITETLTPNLPCTHYYVVLPLQAGDKTEFHPDVASELARVHALGSNFHAIAEFHEGAWREWIAESPGTRDWFKAGVTFRKKMATAGFDVHSGSSDTWIIQEFPTTLVSPNNGIDPKVVRKGAADQMRGLYTGDGSVPRKKGGAMRAGHGQAMDNLTPAQIDWIMNEQKKNIEAWLEDDAFWGAANAYLRFWNEETYADPHVACQPDTMTAERSRSISDYAFHVPMLADAGGSRTTKAREFFHKAFMPLMSGAWMNDVGYGDTNVSFDAMQQHMSTEVYAVKAFFGSHTAYKGMRFGIAWVPTPETDAGKAQIDDLGKRVGNAINGAFAEGHGASYACSPSGAYTFCQCSVPSAKFVPQWGTAFTKW